MASDGVFDLLVASGGRIDLGVRGQSPSITAGFGPPVADEATGSIYCRRDAPSAPIALYVRQAGGWQPLAANISVASEAALTAFDAGSLPEGATAYVASHRSMWTIRTQSLALAPNQVVASSVATRQWTRQVQDPHDSWSLQATWHVNGNAGSNENDGATALTALRSFDEYIRRVGGRTNYVNQRVDVFFDDGTGAGPAGSNDVIDDFVWSPIVGPLGFIYVHGGMIQTDAGTLTAATRSRNLATNAYLGVTDAAQTWANHLSELVLFTNGPAAGASAWVAKDEGAHVGRLSSCLLVDPTTQFVTTTELTPVSGNAYTINRPRRIVGDCAFTPTGVQLFAANQGRVVVEDVEFAPATTGGRVPGIVWCSTSAISIITHRCRFTSLFVKIGASVRGLYDCCFPGDSSAQIDFAPASSCREASARTRGSSA